jgi:hypothetical protein
MSKGIKEIPGLLLAEVEPGQSEPVKYGERIIPETFMAVFGFEDLSKVRGIKKPWHIHFNVRITEHGSPVLESVTIYGADSTTVQRWQLKVAEQYRQILLELSIELAITKYRPTVMLRREYNIENRSISRALTKAGQKTNQIVLEHPSTITGILPNGERADFVRFWDGNPKPLTGDKLKKLLRDISKSVRQRVTPEFLQEVARIYTEAVEHGLDPIKQLKDIYNCKPRTAQEWATKARAPHLGFLPPTTQGKVTIESKTNRKGTI